MDFLRLFNWYHENKRNLPWRKTINPYYIWVSEIMLQQTQVDTVLKYYEDFLIKFPTIESLNEASIDDILHSVQGIGYYKRFQALKKGAKYIVDNFNGVFPDDYEDIIKIPGIGLYTAGAISSIAFNKAHAATDGNVIRVLSRFYGLDDDFRLDKNKKKLNQKNQSLIEKSNDPYTYTQSLMELGATVCKPKKPDCLNCPLNEFCYANLNSEQEKYPFLSPLNKKKEIIIFSFVVHFDDCIIMKKRKDKLLENMYQFIEIEGESLESAINELSAQGIDILHTEYKGYVKHVFTHLIWHIHVYEGYVKEVPKDYELVLDINQKPLSTVHKKIYHKVKK
ncbi:A/G-specific adenine glycosylase [Acholeplasma equifetale]|uniref:A/G-specific adenine glycosylase n=1 Tax=Acholeplasma equifetale TaxID=264634 RepID=UPI0005574E82|nr:A/G-specific adenine glycosylase [Acholeplasma equifetale]